MALTRQHLWLGKSEHLACLTKKRHLKHNLHLGVGNPCPCSGSTTLSSQHSSLPSSWQNLHCNHMALKWWHIHHHPGLGNLCHELCNTTASWGCSNQPSNWPNPLRNCKDLLAVVVLWAQLVEEQREALLLVGLAKELGNLCGALCNTMPSWPLAIGPQYLWHNSKGQLCQ